MEATEEGNSRNIHVCIYIHMYKNLVLHLREISSFVSVYLFPLVLLFLSSIQINNFKLTRWFLLTLKH